MSASSKMSRQQRKRDKERRAKDRWRKEHMQKLRQKNEDRNQLVKRLGP
jgi:hypothetical protein